MLNSNRVQIGVTVLASANPPPSSDGRRHAEARKRYTAHFGIQNSLQQKSPAQTLWKGARRMSSVDDTEHPSLLPSSACFSSTASVLCCSVKSPRCMSFSKLRRTMQRSRARMSACDRLEDSSCNGENASDDGRSLKDRQIT